MVSKTNAIWCAAAPPGLVRASSCLATPRRARLRRQGLRVSFWWCMSLGIACSRKSGREELVLSVASAGIAVSAAVSSNAKSSVPAPSNSAFGLSTSAQELASVSEPTVLLTLPIPAYHASVYIDGEDTYLLTSAAAYRIRPNQKPSIFRLDLGSGAVMTATAFVFWSKGAVWQAPKSGGPSQRLGTVSHRPQYFVSDGRDVFWVDKSDEGRFTIQRLEGKNPSIVYTSVGSIDAATMLNAWVFFVERTGDGLWRFGATSSSAKGPAFTPKKQGRTPAMLVASTDLYYYDGSSREVRQISPDLQHEETIVEEMICSPIAVAERLFCAQVEGVFDLARNPPSVPRKLYEARSAIAAIAASDDRVVWVSDVGQNELAVNSITLD